MKPVKLLTLVLLASTIGLATVVVANRPRITAMSQAAVLEPTPRSGVRGKKGGKKAKAKTPEVPFMLAGIVANSEEIRRRLKQNERGTYIAEILLQRDSALVRWPERTIEPLRVWIGNSLGVEGWDPVHAVRVEEAFSEWSQLGIPVKFTFVPDSVDADVHVSWVDSFREPISGKTLWARDKRWLIVSGSITLALHHNAGEALDGRAIKAIALHEVGHLLGLDHTADTTNIMTARVRVRDLSDADRRTMRLLYSLPPGSVKK